MICLGVHLPMAAPLPCRHVPGQSRAGCAQGWPCSLLSHLTVMVPDRMFREHHGFAGPVHTASLSLPRLQQQPARAATFFLVQGTWQFGPGVHSFASQCARRKQCKMSWTLHWPAARKTGALSCHSPFVWLRVALHLPPPPSRNALCWSVKWG